MTLFSKNPLRDLAVWPVTAVLVLVKGILMVAAIPFAMIFLMFQVALMAVSWAISFAAVIVAVGAIAAAVLFLLIGPLNYFLNHSSARQKEAPHVAYAVAPLDEVPETTDAAVMIGPLGHRIEIRRSSQGRVTKVDPRYMRNRRGRMIQRVYDENDVFWGHDPQKEEADTEREQPDAEAVDVGNRDAVAIAIADDVPEPALPEAPAAPQDPASVASNDLRPVAPAEHAEEPDWVNEYNALPAGYFRAKCGPFESRGACEEIFQESLDDAVEDFVRGRAEAIMADLNAPMLPWHEAFVVRTARRLKVEPVDEYLKVHDSQLNVAGSPARTYFKYGLFHVPPALSHRMDREITSWARSFQIGSVWSIGLAGLASIYLFLKFGAWQMIRSRPRWLRRMALATAVAVVVGCLAAVVTYL